MTTEHRAFRAGDAGLVREAVREWEAAETDAANASDNSPWSYPEAAAKRARLYEIIATIESLQPRAP